MSVRRRDAERTAYLTPRRAAPTRGMNLGADRRLCLCLAPVDALAQ